MDQSYGIAAFRSRQQVMRLERQLSAMGVSAKVISTPREVALGCGLSVRFDLNNAAQVSKAVSQMDTANMVGVYRVDMQNGRSRLTSLYRKG